MDSKKMRYEKTTLVPNPKGIEWLLNCLDRNFTYGEVVDVWLLELEMHRLVEEYKKQNEIGNDYLGEASRGNHLMVSCVLGLSAFDGMPPHLPYPDGFENSPLFEVFKILQQQQRIFLNRAKINFARVDAFLKRENDRKEEIEDERKAS